MELLEKLRILAGGAKYDVSCATGGAVRRNSRGQPQTMPGICHSWSADGRCVALLKVLFTNACAYDCKYCINRRSNTVPRAAFTPEELASLTVEFYRRNYIEGLFLSSGVVGGPDSTMELLLKSIRLLRVQHRFRGYVHLKIVPGTAARLVDEAARLADRISVNAEFASADSLTAMAPDKNWAAVLGPMTRATEAIAAADAERKAKRMSTPFAATSQSTQIIVGATPDTDKNILTLADRFYQKERMKRVYYSAYVPVNTAADAPAGRPPLAREHRLYQADWLLRWYGFNVDELLTGQDGNLDLALDPKTAWALAHPELFPLEVNTAPYEMLLRVPGVGVRGAERIVAARREQRLRPEDLTKLNIIFKRARYFLIASGIYSGGIFDAGLIRRKLLPPVPSSEKQLTFLAPAGPSEEQVAAVTGEM